MLRFVQPVEKADVSIGWLPRALPLFPLAFNRNRFTTGLNCIFTADRFTTRFMSVNVVYTEPFKLLLRYIWIKKVFALYYKPA